MALESSTAAKGRLTKAVADLLNSRNNNIYAKKGYYEGYNSVNIDGTVYPSFCSVDVNLYEGKSVVCVLNPQKTMAYIVGD